MARAARSDSLVERVDQLADVYGEVLLGLYDELTDQRERTEAVAARADALLSEARRLMDDMGSVATQARAIETEAAQLAPVVQAPAPAAAPVRDEETEARTHEALARLGVLESMATTLETSVRERTDEAVARCEALTRGLDGQMRALVQQSVDSVRSEVQQTVTDLRQHVRELLDAVAREAHESARRAEVAAASATAAAANAPAASAPAPAAPAPQIDTDALVEEVRRQASVSIAQEVRQHAANAVADQVGQAAATIAHQARQDAAASVADQVRQQAAAAVAIEVREQATNLADELRRRASAAVEDATAAPAAAAPTAAAQVVPSEHLWAQLHEEIERRTSNFSAAAQRAEQLANRLDAMVNETQTHLQDAKNDRAAAAFALRESRSELDAAKRTLDLSDYSFTLDRLRRAELLLYGTAGLAILAIALWLWTLLS